jgi:hypothetical protein
VKVLYLIVVTKIYSPIKRCLKWDWRTENFYLCSIPDLKSEFKIRMETPRSLPGPATYTLPPVIGYEYHDITRNRNPAYTFGMKNTELVNLPLDPCYIKPGRQACFKKNNVPIHTTKEKWVEKVCAHTPGPASYHPERCPIMRGERAPAYKIGLRRHEPMPKPTPGPNTYNIPS